VIVADAMTRPLVRDLSQPLLCLVEARADSLVLPGPGVILVLHLEGLGAILPLRVADARDALDGTMSGEPLLR